MANKKNNNKKNKIPGTIELFQGARSTIALSAIQRSGAGLHKDRRRAKSRKKDWQKDVE